MELGVRKSGLSAYIIGIGGLLTAMGAEVLTLQETMLAIIALSTTVTTIFLYLEA